MRLSICFEHHENLITNGFVKTTINTPTYPSIISVEVLKAIIKHFSQSFYQRLTKTFSMYRPLSI